MQHSPYKNKHHGWIVDCPECGWSSPCLMCDGSKWIEADLGDFDGETVRLHTGETVTVGAGMFWSMDGDELREADISEIAAVMESELA